MGDFAIEYYIIMLMLTIFIYLFFPISIVLTGKKFKLSTLKTFAVVSGIVGKIVFLILSSGAAGTDVASAFLWSFVGYIIMKKKCYIGSDDILPTKSAIIPVFDVIPPNVPIDSIDDISETEEITIELANTGSFFGYRICDDSMNPKFSEGDVVIVREQNYAESGDVVIVSINGTNSTCKFLIKKEDGIVISSMNPCYEDVFLDIKSNSVKIIGKVIELRAKF